MLLVTRILLWCSTTQTLENSGAAFPKL
jgi:hypothetical protein